MGTSGGPSWCWFGALPASPPSWLCLGTGSALESTITSAFPPSCLAQASNLHLQPSELSSSKFLKGRGISSPGEGWLPALFSRNNHGQASRSGSAVSSTDFYPMHEYPNCCISVNPQLQVGFKPSEGGQLILPTAKENCRCRKPRTLGTTHLAEIRFKLVPKETKFLFLCQSFPNNFFIN